MAYFSPSTIRLHLLLVGSYVRRSIELDKAYGFRFFSSGMGQDATFIGEDYSALAFVFLYKQNNETKHAFLVNSLCHKSELDFSEFIDDLDPLNKLGNYKFSRLHNKIFNPARYLPDDGEHYDVDIRLFCSFTIDNKKKYWPVLQQSLSAFCQAESRIPNYQLVAYIPNNDSWQTLTIELKTDEAKVNVKEDYFSTIQHERIAQVPSLVESKVPVMPVVPVIPSPISVNNNGCCICMKELSAFWRPSDTVCLNCQQPMCNDCVKKKYSIARNCINCVEEHGITNIDL